MAEKEYDNQAMRDLRAQIDKLENTKLLPLPTPEVGRSVIWHKGGEESIEIAAIVTARLAPGQVTLMTFEPLAEPKTTQGAFFVKFPFDESQKAAIIKRTGTWDYCAGDKATQAHQELHRNQIQHRIEGLKNSLRLEVEKEMRKEAALKQPTETAKGKGALAGASA